MSKAYDFTHKRNLEGRFSTGLILTETTVSSSPVLVVAVKIRRHDDAFPTNSARPIASYDEGVPKRLVGTVPGAVSLRFHVFHSKDEGAYLTGGDPVCDCSSVTDLAEARAAVKSLEMAHKAGAAQGAPLTQILALAKAFGCEWFAVPDSEAAATRFYSDTNWTYRPVEAVADAFLTKAKPILDACNARHAADAA